MNEIKPKPFVPYFVESDETGEREVCTLTRNTWNVVGTGRFFAYAHKAKVVKEATVCECVIELTEEKP